MASFQTHITVGALATVATAAFVYSLGISTPVELLVLVLVGTFGSILPDIDSDHSRSSLIVFNIIAVVSACLYFVRFYADFPFMILLTFSSAIYISIRFPLKWLFGKFTIHRGIFHSVLAAMLMSLLGVTIASKIFACNAQLSWLAGTFILSSYLVHLLLDEIYSVDFSNQRIKRSFGTALKPFCFRRPHNSIIALALGVAVFTFTPDFRLTQEDQRSRITAASS